MHFYTDLNGCSEELTDENSEIQWECSYQLWSSASMKLLNKFKFWISKNTNYSYVYHKNDLSESIVIDFENDIYIARFTVWDDLSCMSEIIDLNTEQYKINKREEFTSFNQLLSIFRIFSDYLNTKN